MYKLKTMDTGDGQVSVDKFKARLCAGGHRQHYLIDWEEAFAPTVKLDSFRLLMSLVAQHNLDLTQIDFKSAFLHGKVENPVYMQMPKGLRTYKDGREQVAKVIGNVYGLHQSSRVWFKLLRGWLVSYGFEQMQSDQCVYVYRKGNKFLILFSFVDDCGIITNCTELRRDFMKDLQKDFEVDDMGNMHYFLGMKISKEENSVSIDSSKYISEKLTEFGLENCNPASTPMAEQDKTTGNTTSPLDSTEHSLFRSIVGALIWLSTTTRVDVSFAASSLSQRVQSPTQGDLSNAKRAFRYLKGTKDDALTYRKEGKADLTIKQRSIKDYNNVVGNSDADWAASKTDRKSITGYDFRNAGAAISWKTKKQPTVALSTYESEYLALSSATQHALFLLSLLKELSIVPLFRDIAKTPLLIFGDNQSALKTASEQALSTRAKHIDIRHHFVLDVIKRGDVKVLYVKSEDNPADMLTKSLHKIKFHKFRSDLMGIPLPSWIKTQGG